MRYKSPPPFLSRSSELFQSPYFLNRYLNILYRCKFYYCRDHNDYGIRYKDLLDDLVDLKLQYLLDEIEKILNKWQIKSATEFLEQTRDGTIEEGEDDAITLTHLLDQREELFQLKAQSESETMSDIEALIKAKILEKLFSKSMRSFLYQPKFTRINIIL